MSDDGVPVKIIDAATGEAVDAELTFQISEDNLKDWDDNWVPDREEKKQELEDKEIPRHNWPQSMHWKWREKLGHAQLVDLASASIAITADGVTQGMMTLKLTERSRLPQTEGQHLVYVDYLEIAPWNWSGFDFWQPKYQGIGSLLMRAAVWKSMDEGFKGRLGLHSLPQSQGFYTGICGMENLGGDAAYQGLSYFEMTEEKAKQFYDGGPT